MTVVEFAGHLGLPATNVTRWEGAATTGIGPGPTWRTALDACLHHCSLDEVARFWLIIGDHDEVARLGRQVVANWSAFEICALRQARALSVADFAAHLGVTSRVATMWEHTGTRPRMVNQAALDTSLLQTTQDEAARFWVAVREVLPGPALRRSAELSR
jgi:DNA-binding transcriptional regulator YiaG